MPQRYFDKFPTITYSNTEVVDITKRTALLERVSNNPYVFYPYEITEGERADQLSARYYDDQYKSWMLYISNKMVDPYYEWYLSSNEFEDFIVKKYGSYYDAETRIKFFRNNWVGQENISVSAFNALAYDQKKYWEPNYGSGSKVLEYSRKQVDWVTTTNKIMSYTAPSIVNMDKSFIKDEICTIHFDNYNIGKGQIVSTSNNKIMMQHVSGTYKSSNEVIITVNSYIYGHESEANTTFTNSNELVTNINANEEIYWTPVTYLDYENEKNEYNKSIRVIDNTLSQTMADNLKTLMKE